MRLELPVHVIFAQEATLRTHELNDLRREATERAYDWEQAREHTQSLDQGRTLERTQEQESLWRQSLDADHAAHLDSTFDAELEW